MKMLEWAKYFDEMALKNKRVYTLTEIAAIDGIKIENAKTILQRLKKNGILINCYKNIWGVPGTTVYDIAPMLDPDCYCSMETALYKYNIIKQSPQYFSFVSRFLSKKIETRCGIICFHKIKDELWFGFDNTMAEAEKALLDYLYFCFKEGRKPFTDYDITNMHLFDSAKLFNYLSKYPKSMLLYVNKHLSQLLQ